MCQVFIECAPRALDSPPPLASASRCEACTQRSSRLQGPGTTQLTWEVKSPQTSPPWDAHLFLNLRVLSSHATDV
eukprot:3909373-Pleurochrysis_carterae.AAC.1